MPLEVKVIKKRDYVYIVELNGSLDTATHHELEKELQEILDIKAKAVIMNMAGVKYISSVGIGVIVWLKNELERRNASFTMTNLQPQIKKVLDVMKLIPVIDILEDVDAADEFIDEIMNEESEKDQI